ncbi:hypothetical protein PUR49_02630 [Streptomyces sp. BE147]|uniref:hypothetical protein n=1 Tax=Streptomyces sp. BE147 TaxID=3002524 RepID=UPI002E7615E3|nr:hypothetical protein [Streptomyces sp. BE147]MEE1735431.1 hypothetical protein [Streptomyces sp. BE147]
MTQLSRHGRLAKQYWETYRPQALEELGTPEEQQDHFVVLDMRVTERIGSLADQMLLEVPMQERAAARNAVRAQARELVYDQEVFLPKEPGTEHREM